MRREIAYQVIGGTKFYERAEIKDAIAYLSLLANPFDVVSFTRVVNSPRRGIGQTSLSRVLANAEALGISVWEAAARPEEVPGLGAAAVKALRRFMDTMQELAVLAGGPAEGGVAQEARESSPGVPVGDLIEAMLTQSGYVEALEAERTIEAQGRIENLQELIEVGHEFDARVTEGEDTLGVFLQEVSLVADADTRTDDEGLVTLMTVHNAKGTEYPTIFVTGLEDGVFPHSRAIDEGAPRGGAAAVLRRGYARDARSLPHPRTSPGGVRGADLRVAQPLPRRGAGRSARRTAGADVSPWRDLRAGGRGPRRVGERARVLARRVGACVPRRPRGHGGSHGQLQARRGCDPRCVRRRRRHGSRAGRCDRGALRR